MYVLAQAIIDLTATINIGQSPSIDFLWFFILFAAFSLFLIADLGEIIKMEAAFPFKRTSRYTHELIVAFWFLASFAFLRAQSSLSIFAFGMAVLWGGIWCNQLKEEYWEDESRIHHLARTLRDLQYAGGAVFLLEVGVFLWKNNGTQINRQLTICFLTTYLVWVLFYSIYPVVKNGDQAKQFIVNTIVPDRLITTTDRNWFRSDEPKEEG